MLSRRSAPLHMLAFALALIAIFTVLTPTAMALKDESNQKRWETPTNKGPDAVVPGFLLNMGPTGARGILKTDTIVVKYVFKGSPAQGQLKVDDVVYGVDGKKFAQHTFGGRAHGLEGPIQDMGLAIEEAEGTDGVLELMVKRDNKKMTVKIQLEKLGRFAATFPVKCKKTKVLKERAYKYLMENHGGMSSQGRAVCILSMLSSDDPKVSAFGKKLALGWNRKHNDQVWSWHLGFQGITLAEYHLLTGDKSVLGTLKHTLDLLSNAQ